MGYSTHSRLIRATQVGGAIDQGRLLVVRCRKDVPAWEWAKTEESETSRPMSNLLTPPGLVKPWVWKTQLPRDGLKISNPYQEPMPWKESGGELPWIQMERGYRKLSAEEMGKGLGVGKGVVLSSPKEVPPSSTARLVCSTGNILAKAYDLSSLNRRNNPPRQLFNPRRPF